VARLAFTLTLRAGYRDALLMCGATVLGLGANEVGRAVFGKEAAVFIAALVVGIVGGLIGSRLRRSALVFIVPGVLMLVPGSAGFNSVLELLSNQTVSGITAAFDTFVTAMSIAYGLIASAAVFPARGLGWRRPRRFMIRAGAASHLAPHAVAADPARLRGHAEGSRSLSATCWRTCSIR
jgi:uncharacterized membrane protein YjjB (DUF3815 family)